MVVGDKVWQTGSESGPLLNQRTNRMLHIRFSNCVPFLPLMTLPNLLGTKGKCSSSGAAASRTLFIELCCKIRILWLTGGRSRRIKSFWMVPSRRLISYFRRKFLRTRLRKSRPNGSSVNWLGNILSVLVPDARNVYIYVPGHSGRVEHLPGGINMNEILLHVKFHWWFQKEILRKKDLRINSGLYKIRCTL